MTVNFAKELAPMSRLTYRHTIAASYLGYITQAIVNNLAPLLFVTFMSEFSLTLEQITMMTTVNFAVQLLVDLLRNEWGFDGMVITDAYTNLTGYGYMDPVLAVYARNNELLCMLWSVCKITLSPSMKLAYKNDPIGFGTALRDCTKGILKNKMLTKAFLETV